jgi:putative transposase
MINSPSVATSHVSVPKIRNCGCAQEKSTIGIGSGKLPGFSSVVRARRRTLRRPRARAHRELDERGPNSGTGRARSSLRFPRLPTKARERLRSRPLNWAEFFRTQDAVPRACQPRRRGAGRATRKRARLLLAFPQPKRRGGSRPGAGRKPRAAHLRHTPHRSRPVHRKTHPVHITLRAGTRSLRTQRVARTLLVALRDSTHDQFRIVHFSIQENHVHLIVEAEDTAALMSGARGLMVRIARRVNRLLWRRGRFWADRWHGRALEGPRQVRNALVYVLHNHKKHSRSEALDPLSSAASFDGFATAIPCEFRSVGPPWVVAARTWLLAKGWRRRGLIRLSEAPA